ncbi:ComEC/Rec2 family competence protein [Nocardioides sp. CFH 31398]|uniref:ComEC/Rec2 family competence protein n=1 Tax=Nocardioides sp. CFH 31398 TaxID=2919579 RepID=UPI001F05953B|nr:ComEC/Rec2 family competence protein [Nocardioides sp. CFH 31398]MCH1868413.1 ComEC/Rec2 family competence protein [Nocardioides sp. CFH 31398]
MRPSPAGPGGPPLAEPVGDPEQDPAERPDLRTPALALAAWAGGLLGLLCPPPVLAVVLGVLVVTGAFLGRRARRRGRVGPDALRAVGGCLLVLVGVAVVAGVRVAVVAQDPVTLLAADAATVRAAATVTSDPRLREGGFAPYVLLRARVHEVSARGARVRTSAPVLVVADASWRDVDLGSRVELTGRLEPADGGDLAGLLVARGAPDVRAPPGVLWCGADAVRASVREAVAHRPPSQAGLVPALVVGDDSTLPDDLEADFAATGLTHLLAVSGTNLTLLVGFLLLAARWCGVRGRWLHLVGAVGIVGFVLLARTEPSVVRAAAMGTVALIGMGSNGPRRGTRSLGVAVTALLLVHPWYALSAGFALSVLATAGILLLAPGWRDALARRAPRWLAEAITVPAAAQLACTPVVAAISGQVSLVAVVANLLAAPAVGPATVLGLLAGLVGLVWPWAATLVGTVASWCVAWIVLVARRGAALPTAAVDWDTSAAALALLTALCVGIAVLLPALLRSRGGLALCAGATAVTLGVPLPTPGWPAEGWVLAACDVGQGDALVLRAGPDSGVVVDTGPEPALVDRCLSRLGIDRVPLVVVTHFHADHADGLPGVLRGREVGAVEVTAVAEPAEGAEAVSRAAADAGVVVRVPAYGETRRVGEVTVQVLAPLPGVAPAAGAEGDAANDASLVVLAEVGGTSVLLTGDLEPPGQEALAASVPGLTVDVLKVPHHGSRHQDLDLLLSLGAELALVSVGEDNTYGHPSEEVLDPLEDAGVEVGRTDEQGDLLVVPGDDGPELVTAD